jgi:hypothetical protein
MNKRFTILLITGSFLLLSLTWLVRFSVFREGIQVVTHYMFGNGSDLQLRSDHIPHSPVIRKRLASMQVGETVRVSFRQQDDWRLSYAINGFQLTKTKTGFRIYQRIEFDQSGKVYTDIKTPFGNIRLFDNWVHVIDCKAFRLFYNHDWK